MPRVRPLAGESPIEKDNKVFLLTYDQGLEHGPADFNEETVDPGFVLDIAEHGPFTGIVLQKGVAAAYYRAGKYTVPLLIKLNGRTNLAGDKDPYSPMVCTVDEAVALGAKAVGYTMYLGSTHESQMMSEFSHAVRDAHERSVPVVVWMRIVGSRVDPTERDILAYAGRVALELGADYAQLEYAGSVADYAWVVESAGRCKVVAPGGEYADKADSVKLARSVMQAGAAGLTIGRRIWQDRDPLSVALALKQVLWKE